MFSRITEVPLYDPPAAAAEVTVPDQSLEIARRHWRLGGDGLAVEGCSPGVLEHFRATFVTAPRDNGDGDALRMLCYGTFADAAQYLGRAAEFVTVSAELTASYAALGAAGLQVHFQNNPDYVVSAGKGLVVAARHAHENGQAAEADRLLQQSVEIARATQDPRLSFLTANVCVLVAQSLDVSGADSDACVSLVGQAVNLHRYWRDTNAAHAPDFIYDTSKLLADSGNPIPAASQLRTTRERYGLDPAREIRSLVLEARCAALAGDSADFFDLADLILSHPDRLDLGSARAMLELASAITQPAHDFTDRFRAVAESLDGTFHSAGPLDNVRSMHRLWNTGDYEGALAHYEQLGSVEFGRGEVEDSWRAVCLAYRISSLVALHRAEEAVIDTRRMLDVTQQLPYVSVFYQASLDCAFALGANDSDGEEIVSRVEDRLVPMEADLSDRAPSSRDRLTCLESLTRISEYRGDYTDAATYSGRAEIIRQSTGKVA